MLRKVTRSCQKMSEYSTKFEKNKVKNVSKRLDDKSKNVLKKTVKADIIPHKTRKKAKQPKKIGTFKKTF